MFSTNENPHPTVPPHTKHARRFFQGIWSLRSKALINNKYGTVGNSAKPVANTTQLSGRSPSAGNKIHLKVAKQPTNPSTPKIKKKYTRRRLMRSEAPEPLRNVMNDRLGSSGANSVCPMWNTPSASKPAAVGGAAIVGVVGVNGSCPGRGPTWSGAGSNTTRVSPSTNASPFASTLRLWTSLRPTCVPCWLSLTSSQRPLRRNSTQWIRDMVASLGKRISAVRPRPSVNDPSPVGGSVITSPLRQPVSTRSWNTRTPSPDDLPPPARSSGVEPLPSSAAPRAPKIERGTVGRAPHLV